MRFRPENVLVSCEHASNRVPARYRGLGLGRRQLESHIAWDPGAAVIARRLARRLGAPLHLGRWSRLLIDLNRSPGHPKLVARETFGVRVPGNQDLAPGERERRLRLYHAPYRLAAQADVRRIIERSGFCLHLSIHSFTPVVAGVVRRADVGLLYDPSRARERALARALARRLAGFGFHVRANYPYRGVSDSFTTALRRRLPAKRYAALEIETNQALLRKPSDQRHVARALTTALALALAFATETDYPSHRGTH